ncbi:hypothetical protein M0R45_016365 [Rubus argutus]|uniref:Uncharacterized protein n=1 Tax=Rubus argutus TaxID=59490 RepID=A0AAW1XRQ9_RUBAR
MLKERPPILKGVLQENPYEKSFSYCLKHRVQGHNPAQCRGLSIQQLHEWHPELREAMAEEPNLSEELSSHDQQMIAALMVRFEKKNTAHFQKVLERYVAELNKVVA